MSQKYNIVLLSNQFYDQPLKTNKWHVSTRLAAQGHNVIFVDPPTRFKVLKEAIKSPIQFLSTLFSPIKKLDSGVYKYTPINLFNFGLFSRLNIRLQIRVIDRQLAAFEKNPSVLWIYHFDYPALEDLVRSLQFDVKLYDVVDEYAAFPEYSRKVKTNTGLVSIIQSFDDWMKIRLNQDGLSGKDWVIKREYWLSEVCDLIFASAPGLVLKFENILKNQHSIKSVHFIPNSGDYQRFKDSKTYKERVPQDLEILPRPRITYAGAIDTYKMNLPLVEACARTYPDYSFVLLGPEKVSDLDLTQLKKLSNVTFLGTRPYESLPYYFAGSDVFVIPYNLNEYTIGGCFPVKFHDALSAGLPVVVTDMPAYKPFSDVCYIAKTESDYVSMIKLALEEDNEQKFNARREVAKNNSWEGKVSKQLQIISTFLTKK